MANIIANLLRNENLLTSVIFSTGAFQCHTQTPIFVDHILSPFLKQSEQVNENFPVYLLFLMLQ